MKFFDDHKYLFTTPKAVFKGSFSIAARPSLPDFSLLTLVNRFYLNFQAYFSVSF